MDPKSSDGNAQPHDEETGPGRVVLVVDDSAIVLRTTSRILKLHFDEVFIAESPDEAVALLEQHRVTNLLCDNNLGDELPLGIELIPQWRDKHPTIKRAVLHTASDIPKLDDLNGIDAILAKPATSFEILRAVIG